jgi:hypothetical protein
VARKKHAEPDHAGAQGAFDDEISDAEYEAGVKALEQQDRERIAKFQQQLRARKVDWPEEDPRLFLQELRPLITRAVFRNAPLDGSPSTPDDAEATVLDVAAALARHAQRMVTRRETAAEGHADIREALEAEVVKRGGRLARGVMKRIYSDVARLVTKARKAAGRAEVHPRTVQRVWLKMNQQRQ